MLHYIGIIVASYRAVQLFNNLTSLVVKMKNKSINLFNDYLEDKLMVF